MSIRIISAGFLTTVQDMGRYGFGAAGISPGGAMDTHAAALANILVGNDENEALLEATVTGPSIEFGEDEYIAVTGGDLGAKLDGIPVPLYEAILARKGQILSFSGPVKGSRAYIAFAGALDIPVVLGSRSTNFKLGIGGFKGRKLEAGDKIGLISPTDNLTYASSRKLPVPDIPEREVTLRVILGPQDDCFTREGIETFLTGGYIVSDEYDRMGCRLEGPVIEHKGSADIITDGINFGAVQVPADGNPIIMMADHQTTGGYAKIANVISVDLGKLAQCMPGTKVLFQAVTAEKAQDLYCEWRDEIREIRKKFSSEETEKETGPVREYTLTVNGVGYEVKIEERPQT